MAATAQTPAAQPAIPVIAAQPGQLQAVREGLVEIVVGAPFDIANTKILIVLKAVRDAESAGGAAIFNVNGSEHYIALGNKLDFKNRTKDKENCYFDVVGLKAPRGAPASAILRVDCM